MNGSNKVDVDARKGELLLQWTCPDCLMDNTETLTQCINTVGCYVVDDKIVWEGQCKHCLNVHTVTV